MREDNRELDIIRENSKLEAAIRQTEATAPKKEFSSNSISHLTEKSTENKKKLKMEGTFLSRERRTVICAERKLTSVNEEKI